MASLVPIVPLDRKIGEPILARAFSCDDTTVFVWVSIQRLDSRKEIVKISLVDAVASAVIQADRG